MTEGVEWLYAWQLDGEDLTQRYQAAHGLTFVEVSDGEHLSVSRVIVAPRTASRPHYHPYTDVIVHLLSSPYEGAVTLSGPDLAHCVMQQPNSIIRVHRNVPHMVVNRGDEPLVALEYRSAPMRQGNVLMPELYDKATTILRDVFDMEPPAW